MKTHKKDLNIKDPFLASFTCDKKDQDAEPVAKQEEPDVVEQVLPPVQTTPQNPKEEKHSPIYDEDVWGDLSESKSNDVQEQSVPIDDESVWGEPPRSTKQKLQDKLHIYYQQQLHLLLLLKRRFRHFNGKVWLPVFFGVLLLFLAGSMLKENLLTGTQSRGLLLKFNVALKLKDTDWKVSENIKLSWIESHKGRDLLLVKGVIENRLKASLPLPFIRVRMYAEDDTERLIQEFILPIKKVTDDNVLSVSPEDLPMDLDKMNALEKRPFALVVEHLAYDVGRITMRPTLRRPE
ncbi:MAG: hypothetical protein Q9M28_02440 [Mariprofundaceae bacterium]|nr:hypothetical protein [Mariprofundaceae bacterium]